MFFNLFDLTLILAFREILLCFFTVSEASHNFLLCFYPRKFELSKEFIDAFKLEYSRLSESGQNKKTLLERIRKALSFHL